jgi:hypothetical protein
MEVVVGAEIPSRYPQQDIVPHAKEPYQGEVRVRYDTGAIRHISQQQTEHLRVAVYSIQSTVSCSLIGSNLLEIVRKYMIAMDGKENVHEYKREDCQALYPGRYSVPAERLCFPVAKYCGNNQTCS